MGTRNDAVRKLKGLASYYRQGGVGEVLVRLSAYGYLPKPVFSLSVCHLFLLNDINPRSLSRPLQGYHFARGTRALLDELVACQGNDRQTPLDVFDRFFDVGADCYVARAQGEVVGYFWGFRGRYRLHFDAHPRHALTIILRDDDVFFGNGFIAPAHRLRGVFPHLVDFVASHYPNARRFSSVNHINRPSLRAHDRLGFARVATLTCADIGTVRTFHRSGGARTRTLLGLGPSVVDIDDCVYGKNRAAGSRAVSAPAPETTVGRSGTKSVENGPAED